MSGKNKKAIGYASLLSAVFMTACLATAPAAAEPPPESYTDFTSSLDFLPNSFGEKDDRVLITDASALPWAAAGQLDIGYELPCTAVQTGARYLATAGHCAVGSTKIKVPELDGELIIPDRTVTYAAGHTGAKPATEVAQVVMFFRPDSYYDKSVRHDFSFAVLDRDVGNETSRLEFLDPAVMDIAEIMALNIPLHQVGYSGDAPDEMTANIGCNVIASEAGGFFYDGDTLPGDSGSPLFAEIYGIYFIAGINHGISTPPDMVSMASFAAPASLMKERFEAFRDYAAGGGLSQHLPVQQLTSNYRP